jgi:hypothetical protein
MAMESVLLALAVLACPVGMGVMMWFMAKGMRKQSKRAPDASIDDLRAEHGRIGEQIESLERARVDGERGGVGR